MVQINLFTKQKRCRKRSYGYQGGKERGGLNWQFGNDTYTVLHMK